MPDVDVRYEFSTTCIFEVLAAASSIADVLVLTEAEVIGVTYIFIPALEMILAERLDEWEFLPDTIPTVQTQFPSVWNTNILCIVLSNRMVESLDKFK